MLFTSDEHGTRDTHAPLSTPRRKQAFQRRARVALLGALGAFVLMQVGLRVVIDHWRPELREPTFEIKYRQLTRLVRGQAERPALMVFLGSSITANGVDAKMMEAPAAAALGRPVLSYNLATYGGGPLTNLIYAKRLLRRGVRPDLVVIELSPLLYDAREGEFDIQRFPARILEYQDLEIIERHSVQPSLRRDWWEANVVPAYGHRMMILNGSARLLLPFKEQTQLWRDGDDHGWHGRDALTPEEYRRNLPELEGRFKDRLARYKMGEGPVNALRELTDMLAQERIAVVLLQMPEGPLIRSYYAPGSTGPLFSEFRSLSSKHGFPLIDAHTWLGDEHFRDSYHLHRDGARVFTARLLAEMIAPAMAKVREHERSTRSAAARSY